MDVVDMVTKPIRAAGVETFCWASRWPDLLGLWVAGGEWIESLWCVVGSVIPIR